MTTVPASTTTMSDEPLNVFSYDKRRDVFCIDSHEIKGSHVRELCRSSSEVVFAASDKWRFEGIMPSQKEEVVRQHAPRIAGSD